MSMWRAWQLDPPTWAWIAWILWFLALETYTLIWDRGQELTAHLRPVLTHHDLAYFIAIALWAWIGWHFLVDGLWVGEALRR